MSDHLEKIMENEDEDEKEEDPDEQLDGNLLKCMRSFFKGT
jgi:hypothetical protein